MDWTKVPSLIVLLNIFGLSNAFFEGCDLPYTIKSNDTLIIQSPGYAQNVGYTPGSSCRYTITAPVDYQIRASCNINMYDPSSGSCSSERFYFGIDGKKDLSTSTFYCGTKTVALTSKGNQMVLAYVSNTYSGIFDCTITAVCDCGWAISSRIVGGTAASPNEFPPMAALVSVTSSKVYCGATVVSSYYVVSAAHCLRVTTVSNTAVDVGEHDVTATSTTRAVYAVLRFIEHPQYSTVTNLNDIGLVQTQKPIVWTRAIAPVCLPFFYSQADFSGVSVTAPGWGSTSFGGPSSNVLQKVDLTVLSNSNTQCTATYPNVASSQMCTYTASKDTCQYDSGGPLFYRGSTDPRLFIVALVSLGEGCGGNTPSLNSRMTSYMSWIESITGSLCRRAIT